MDSNVRAALENLMAASKYVKASLGKVKAKNFLRPWSEVIQFHWIDLSVTFFVSLISAMSSLLISDGRTGA